MTTAPAFRPVITPRPTCATIDTAVTAVTAPDPTLDDVAYLLRQLGQIDGLDLAGLVGHADLVKRQAIALGRYRALCWLAARRIGDLAPEVRAAPSSGLAEVVGDVARPCGAAHLGCSNDVLPWQDDFCTVTCQVDHMRSQGETWDGE